MYISPTALQELEQIPQALYPHRCEALALASPKSHVGISGWATAWSQRLSHTMSVLELQDSAPGHGASSSFSAHENTGAFVGTVLAAQILAPFSLTCTWCCLCGNWGA